MDTETVSKFVMIIKYGDTIVARTYRTGSYFGEFLNYDTGKNRLTLRNYTGKVFEIECGDSGNPVTALTKLEAKRIFKGVNKQKQLKRFCSKYIKFKRYVEVFYGSHTKILVGICHSDNFDKDEIVVGSMDINDFHRNAPYKIPFSEISSVVQLGVVCWIEDGDKKPTKYYFSRDSR